MRFAWRYEIMQLAIIAGMFAVAAWAWPQVPDRLPMHWNIKGEVDGWGGKFEGLLLFPIIMLGVYGLLLVVPRFDPKRANYANFEKAYGIIRVSFMTFMAVMYGAVVQAAFGHAVNMNLIVLVAMGMLFIVLGNFMSKIRPNWFVGVRTPWTLSSTLSWNKTHRLAGWLFIVMGVMALVLAFVQNSWMLFVMLVVDACLLVWIVAYSYVVFRSDPERIPPADASPTAQ